MNKINLRNTLRKKRKRIPKETQLQAQKSLANIVSQLSFFLQSNHIATYIATDGEINPIDITLQAWKLKKKCFLPFCSTTNKNSLSFLPYDEHTKFQKNYLNISEPIFTQSHYINPEDLDLVLLPLTGFDLQGNRLGMGKGYYDYTFTFTHQKKKPLLIGLAYECQKVNKIPIEKHDIPLHGIVTNIKFYPANL